MSAPMPMQTLGRSGLVVSRLGLGSWVSFHYQIQEEEAFKLMEIAYKRGVNIFDNAEAYASGAAEKIMGKAIHLGQERGVWTREDLVITTKIFFGTQGYNAKGLSRKHVIEGAKSSLKRMGLEYVDVIYAHRPDPITPIEEVVRAFNWLIDHGYAFYWGTSEWAAHDIAAACAIADKLGLIRPIVEQPEYNIVSRQRVEHEYAPLYRDNGLGLTTWSPLASGVLTGKYSGKKVPEGSRFTISQYDFVAKSKLEGDDSWQIDAADALKPIAASLGCSLAQLSIAWCLANERVSTVLLGATTPAQLEENLSAVDVLPKLTPDVLAAIDAAVGERARVRKPRVQSQVSGIRSVDTIAGEHISKAF